MSEEKDKTQEMIYIVFTEIPQDEIDAKGFGNWLENTAERLRDHYKSKKVFIHVFGLTLYVISQRVSTEKIDEVGFRRWFGIRRKELADYFNVNSQSVFIKAV